MTAPTRPERVITATAPAPPVLRLAIAISADAGTGQAAAVRLAGALIYLDLQLAVLDAEGLLPELDAELTAAATAGGDQELGDMVWRLRREAAALLVPGPASPWMPPGVTRADVNFLYEQARKAPPPGASIGPARWADSP